MEKRLTIVIGAGGTGSYLVPNLLHFYKGLGEIIENKVILIDGDLVEQKNLLRQGFLSYQLNKSKAEAVTELYEGLTDITLEAKHTFVNSADSILNLIQKEQENLTEVVLISCVDNNYARLRMVVAQMLIKSQFPELAITFLDSGNEEWHGQTIVSHLTSEDLSLLSMDKELILHEENYVPTLDNIFVRNTEWTTNLTRGDHELSCDVIAESHPQNVATNMTASSALILALGNVLRDKKVRNIKYHTLQNTIEGYAIAEKEAYLNRMQEIVTFINEDIEQSVLSTLFLAMEQGKEKVGVSDVATTVETLVEAVVGVENEEPQPVLEDFLSDILGIHFETETAEVEETKSDSEEEIIFVEELVEEILMTPNNDGNVEPLDSVYDVLFTDDSVGRLVSEMIQTVETSEPIVEDETPQDSDETLEDINIAIELDLDEILQIIGVEETVLDFTV